MYYNANSIPFVMPDQNGFPPYYFNIGQSMHRLPSSRNVRFNPKPIIGSHGFQVSLDVQSFRPNEIKVKAVDSTVVVEAKHEMQEDEHGSISRHFIRKYILPAGCDPNKVNASLSSDGILTIEAHLKGEERIIQILHTGPAHLSITEDRPVHRNGTNGTMEKDSGNVSN